MPYSKDSPGKKGQLLPSVLEVQVFTSYALSSVQFLKLGWTRPIELSIDEETFSCKLYNEIRAQFDSIKRIFIEQAETLSRQREQLYAVWRFGHAGHIQAQIFVQRLALRRHQHRLSIITKFGSPLFLAQPPAVPWWPQSQRPSLQQRHADLCSWLPSHRFSPFQSNNIVDGTGVASTIPGYPNLIRQTDDNCMQHRLATLSATAPRQPSTAGYEDYLALSATSGQFPIRPQPECTLPASGLNSPVSKFGRGSWGIQENLLRVAVKGGLDCIFLCYPSGRRAILTCVASRHSEETFHYVFSDTPDVQLIAIAAYCSGFTWYWPNGGIHVFINSNMGVIVENDPLITTTWTGEPPWWKKGTTCEFKLNEVITFRYKGSHKMSLMYHTRRDHLVIDLGQAEYRPTDSADDGEMLPSDMLDFDRMDTQSALLTDTTISAVPIINQLRIEQVLEEWLALRSRLRGLIQKMQALTGMADQIPRRIVTPKAATKQAPPIPLAVTQPSPIPTALPTVFESIREPDAFDMPIEDADRGDLAHPDEEEHARVVKIMEAFLLVVSSTREKKRKPCTWANLVERSRQFVPPACPGVLRMRLLQMDREKKARQRQFCSGDSRQKHIHNWSLCNCNNRNIPEVTDIELQSLLHNKDLVQQVMVICITSSRSTPTQSEEVVTEVYRQLHRKRRKPCVQFPLDYYRMMKYDLKRAARDTKFTTPLLVRQHDVLEGMTMMFLNGNLVFCGYKFNGYGLDRCNFIKQMQDCFIAAGQGFSLPNDFKFGCSYPHALGSTGSITESDESLTSVDASTDSLSGYESVISVHNIRHSLTSIHSDKTVRH